MTDAQTSPTRDGEYLVIDNWGCREVAKFRRDLGWLVRGRWVGFDGVKQWQAVPPLEGSHEVR